MYRVPTFCPFCTANHYDNLENRSLNLQTEFASRFMTYASERVISQNLLKWFSKLSQFLPENLQHTPRKNEQDEIIPGEFYRIELIKVL